LAAAAAAVAMSPSAALADPKPEKSISDVLSNNQAAPFDFYWNAFYILGAVACAGLIFAPVLLVPFLKPPETMLDVKAKPGYQRREYRQPGLQNPQDNKAPTDAYNAGGYEIPKLNPASIVTN